MILVQTATTIDRPPSPTALTCSVCPFARLIEDNRYVCQVSETAADVVRGHWPAKASCHESIAQAQAQAEKVAAPAAAEVEAPIAKTATPAPASVPTRTPSTPAPATLSGEKPAPAPTPAAIGTDNEPPNRGDNGRGRVQPAKTHDRTTSQLAIIREELAAIGIKFGKLIKSREDVKGWNLSWDGDKAGLYWTTGDGWDIESLKSGGELAGNWEGFELMEHLDCNGIELPE